MSSREGLETTSRNASEGNLPIDRGQVIEGPLGELSLFDKNLRTPARSKTHKTEIAESWEDEISSGEDESAGPNKITTHIPNAPPPTPISVSSLSSQSESEPSPAALIFAMRGEVGGTPPGKTALRPEKTDAIAKRMIAGALGVRVPRKTAEEREYEKAIKEKEMKKKNAQRAAQKQAEEDLAKAKASVWDD